MMTRTIKDPATLPTIIPISRPDIGAAVVPEDPAGRLPPSPQHPLLHIVVVVPATSLPKA
jgi:hypothetical protein